MGIKIEVWGDYACFTRPEFKVERVTYDAMTPSAAIGILDSIYWHPGVKYVIDKIHVLNPIKTESLMRNEVREKASISQLQRAMKAGTTNGCCIVTQGNMRQQRSSLVLKDVRYVIEAHFELSNAKANDESKVMGILGERSLKGACYNQPYMGCREFVAKFRQYQGDVVIPDDAKITKDLGYMFHSYDYSDPSNPKPRFFRAILNEGTITVPSVDSGEVYL